jgi:uncharacterized pyridoxal phosphate-containing UPF0001 family protein
MSRVKMFLFLVFFGLSQAASAEQKVDLGSVGPEYGQIAEDKYKKIMEEYKVYLSSVSEKTAKEVKEYRIEVEKINQQKKNLYLRLSQEAQQHMMKEREFKKKLPRKKIGSSSK